MSEVIDCTKEVTKPLEVGDIFRTNSYGDVVVVEAAVAYNDLVLKYNREYGFLNKI